MVKKISGPGSSKPTAGASEVKENSSVQGARVDSLQKVGEVQRRSASGRVRPNTRPMTEEERRFLLNLVEEEAEKLFGEGKLPQSKKNTLTRGIELTIAASAIPEDEDSK